MSEQFENITIVFSDVVGSSQLYASAGNVKAKQTIDGVISLMIKVVERECGKVIKTIGDEIMCAFEDINDAMKAVIAFNQEAHSLNLKLRTGLCCGSVIKDGNDVYGDTVNNAAYLAKIAQANQIIFDRGSYDLLTPKYQTLSEAFDKVQIKGFTSETRVYRLNWEDQNTPALDATMVFSSTLSPELKQASELTIQFLDQNFTLLPVTKLTIGRDADSVDLCINQTNASRKHCSLYFNRGKFILEDHSTNGTYLKPDDGNEIFLRRESTPLLKDGVISIGQSATSNEAVISYFIR